jgi:2-polyprenyl-3-methyl-5-hydroxy-6-metoxy-1,4-benzoquinol methylase
MAESTVCNLCTSQAELTDAEDATIVSCDVSQFQDESFPVWRCRDCDSIHSQQEVDLDRYYSDYFVHQQKLDFVTKTVYRKYIRALQRCGMKQGDKVLDYGCGNGLFLDVIKQRGFETARGFDPYTVEFSDPKTLQTEFDVVIATEVIEHVEDPLAFMQTIASLVRPGGLVAIATPCACGIDLETCDRFQWGLHQPFHRHILSHKVMAPLGRRVGLSQIHLTRRSWDTLWPTVNLRFIVEYIRATGHLADVVVGPPQVARVLSSPRLLFLALFGFFFSPQSSMLAIYRKHAPAHD